MNDQQAKALLEEIRRGNQWQIAQTVLLVVIIMLVVLVGLAMVAKGAEQTGIPADAAVSAYADVQTLDGNTQKFVRYLWLEENTPLQQAAMDVALNMLGHDVNYFNTVRVADGHLLRVDLRWMAGSGARSDAEFAAVRDAWESIFDPSFHILESVTVNQVTVDVQVLSGRNVVAEVKAGTQVEVTGRREKSGDTEFVEVAVNGKKGFVQASQIQETIDQQRFGLGSLAPALDQLAAATQSRAPIVHAPHFLAVAMVAADPGIGHAPLYYRFLDWQGLTLQQLFARYRLRVEDVLDFDAGGWGGKVISAVTKKSRGFTVVNVPTIQPTRALPVWWVSLDFADSSDPLLAMLLNLLNPRPKATELVITKPNGLYAYAVANIEYDDAKLSFLDALRADKVTANLQGEVDQEIASDRKLPPEPATCRLIVGMSCANCHGDEASNGLKPLESDVLKIVRYMFDGLQATFTGDVSNPDDPNDTRKKILARFGADLEPLLDLARVQHRELFARITAQPGKPDGFEPHEVYAEMARIYRDYVYSDIGRLQALEECAGITLEEGDDPEAWFNAVWPPLPFNRFGESPEHLNVLMIRIGVPITRKDFNLVKRDLLLRAAPQVEQFRKLKAMPPMPEVNQPEQEPMND